jgi:EAL domain-containing protein (putative c-di-GMP-specific phosphodiesterase class I)/FixJ family two-component response regulator
MTNKLLIVDDEEAILRALKRLFARAGYQVFTANSGYDALNIMAQEHCQVIISDFRMPVMNGSQLLAAIKAQYPSSLCMILSGFTDFSSVLALLNSGTVFRFLQKPWDETLLYSEVEVAFIAYNKHFDENEVNQLMANSAEALIELYPNGQIGRVNGVAKKIFNLDSSCILIADVFPFCSYECLLTLFNSNIDNLVLKATTGKNVELVLKKTTDKSRFFELQFMNKNDDALSYRKKLASFLDQNEIVNLADSLLETVKPFAMVAIYLKNYSYWTEIIGPVATEKLFDDITLTLFTQSKISSSALAFLTNEHFVLLMDNFTNEHDLHKQLTDFIAPFSHTSYSDKSVRVELVVTYCIAREDGDNAAQLLSNALISNRLHRTGHAHLFMRYDAAIIEQKRKQLFISKALFHAVDNQQLYLHFQPKFDLNQRKITSCEVLLRWEHPQLGNISPVVFIPIAEREGQIIELGYWVIHAACMAISNWTRKGIRLDKVAINISGKQLSQADFIPRVEALLAGFDIDISTLEFELTESWLVNNIEESAEKLTRLKNAGISIAIDDFGTGYSSLSYLSKLPIDVLKIDRSLIIDISDNLNTQSMVGNITRMAHDLGMKVVVEGVEHIEQILILEKLNCDVIQGYIIARPQDEDSFTRLIANADASIAAIMGGI